MAGELTETLIRTIQDAAKKLTGAKRRKFEAQGFSSHVPRARRFARHFCAVTTFTPLRIYRRCEPYVA